MMIVILNNKIHIGSLQRKTVFQNIPQSSTSDGFSESNPGPWRAHTTRKCGDLTLPLSILTEGPAKL